MRRMVSGLDLEYNAKCNCGFCKINKITSQRIHRFAFDLRTSYKIGSKGFWD